MIVPHGTRTIDDLLWYACHVAFSRKGVRPAITRQADDDDHDDYADDGDDNDDNDDDNDDGEDDGMRRRT